jgi:hypothetical protein
MYLSIFLIFFSKIISCKKLAIINKEKLSVINEEKLALGATVPSLSSKVGLNETCNNKLCLIYESVLSCKTFGFHLKKVLEQY